MGLETEQKDWPIPMDVQVIHLTSQIIIVFFIFMENNSNPSKNKKCKTKLFLNYLRLSYFILDYSIDIMYTEVTNRHGI